MNEIKEIVIQMFFQNLEKENEVKSATIERLKEIYYAGKLADLDELNSLVKMMENNNATN